MPRTDLHPQKLIDRKMWHDYRDEIWGDSFNWSWVRPWNQLEGIIIHHTASSKEASPNDIALMHKARGWGGVGYHFIVTPDGVVHYVGDIATARAHVLNKNEKYIGISMVGDFTKHLPTDNQILSVHDLCEFFWYQTPSLPTLKGWEQMKGHKDEQATACPGTSWPNDMQDRIINRIPYTPQPDPVTPVPPTDDTDEPEPKLVCMPQKEYDELMKKIELLKKRSIDNAEAGVLFSKAISKWLGGNNGTK